MNANKVTLPIGKVRLPMHEFVTHVLDGRREFELWS
jgi:hypothetical protein